MCISSGWQYKHGMMKNGPLGTRASKMHIDLLGCQPVTGLKNIPFLAIIYNTR